MNRRLKYNINITPSIRTSVDKIDRDMFVIVI